MFPDLEKRPFVGDILFIPTAHSPLVTRTIRSRGVSYVGSGGGGSSLGVDWLLGGLVGVAGPLIGCQALPCVEAVG